LLNGRELAIVYCFVFLYFWLAGGGEWSLGGFGASGFQNPPTPFSGFGLSPLCSSPAVSLVRYDFPSWL
jgi:hypothetical protein